MNEKKTEIEQTLFNTILQTSNGFSTGEARYRLYPVTLGKEMLLKQHLEAIGAMQTSSPEYYPAIAMNAARTQQNATLRIIALHTFNRKEELQDEDAIAGRMAELGKELEVEEMAALLLLCLREQCKLPELLRITGVDKDKERMRTVQKAKKANRNSITFGGVSIYGRLLDVACERYGWTLDYVLWEISAINLQMMLADQVTTIFVSDEELKDIDSEEEQVICGDDPSNNKKLHEMING